MNCFRMCAAVWCFSAGTAAQPCISPRTIIQFQFLHLRMTGLKTNGTYYNRPIIHICEWKHFKNPLKVLSIQTFSNKTTCSALMHLFHLLFAFKQPIMCVCVLLGMQTSRGVLQEHHFFDSSKRGLRHKLLPSFFAPEPVPFQMRWMVSVATCWSSSGWAIFSWLWGPQL